MTPAAEYTSESAAVEAGLLAAICERPEDDGPRLVYADWLDEHGEGDRASFIRVQCELARLQKYQVDDVAAEPGLAAFLALREREEKLWNRIGVSLFNDSGIAFPGHSAKHSLTAKTGFALHRIGGGASRVLWARGFLDSVSLRCAEFVGGPCGRCGGTGTIEQYEGALPDAECPTCKGKRTLPGLAAELARRHPIERVRLTDAEPWNGTSWYDAAQFPPANDEHPPSSIPSELFARLAGGYEPSARCRVYDEPKLANLALGLAACRYARAAAGLTGSPKTP
jgi:uncharacterized protein (TIGR02996 family)